MQIDRKTKKWIYREADRDRQEDRQVKRQTQANRYGEKQASRHKVNQAGKQILVRDGETHRQGETDRQTDTMTHSQTDWLTDKPLLPPTFTVSLVRRAVTTPAITPIRRPPKQTTKNLTMPRIIWSAAMSSIKLSVCITLYSTTVTPSGTHKTSPTLIPSHQPDLNHTTHSISCDPTTSTLLKSHNTQYLLWFHEIHLTQITQDIVPAVIPSYQLDSNHTTHLSYHLLWSPHIHLIQITQHRVPAVIPPCSPDSNHTTHSTCCDPIIPIWHTTHSTCCDPVTPT